MWWPWKWRMIGFWPETLATSWGGGLEFCRFWGNSGWWPSCSHGQAGLFQSFDISTRCHLLDIYSCSRRLHVLKWPDLSETLYVLGWSAQASGFLFDALIPMSKSAQEQRMGPCICGIRRVPGRPIRLCGMFDRFDTCFLFFVVAPITPSTTI